MTLGLDRQMRPWLVAECFVRTSVAMVFHQWQFKKKNVWLYNKQC